MKRNEGQLLFVNFGLCYLIKTFGSKYCISPECRACSIKWTRQTSVEQLIHIDIFQVNVNEEYQSSIEVNWMILS